MKKKSWLIQIFLPQKVLNDRGVLSAHEKTKIELTKDFGGVSCYSRPSVEGLWKHDDKIQRDTMVIYEVMTKKPNRHWWKNYRRFLEKRFKQKSVLIRAERIHLL